MAKIRNVEINKTKYGTYALHFTNNEGRMRRISAGKDRINAQRLAVKFSDWLLEGKDPEKEIQKMRQEEASMKMTLREFYPEYMHRHGNHQSKSMKVIYSNRFKNIDRCESIAGVPLCEISRQDVLLFMHSRQNDINPKTGRIDSNATINREYSMIRAMLNKAVDWGYLQHNPANRISLLEEAPKRNVTLTPDQAAALLQDLRYPTRDIFRFSIYSGFRIQNILSLTIEQIQYKKIDGESIAEISLCVKMGRWEIFPVCSYAVDILKRNIGSRKSGYVFINHNTGTRFKDIHKSFNVAVRKLNVKVNNSFLRIHDLRHVLPTWLHQEGVGDDTIREALGHRDIATTDRYITRNRSSVARVFPKIPEIPEIDEKTEYNMKIVGKKTG